MNSQGEEYQIDSSTGTTLSQLLLGALRGYTYKRFFKPVPMYTYIYIYIHEHLQLTPFAPQRSLKATPFEITALQTQRGSSSLLSTMSVQCAVLKIPASVCEQAPCRQPPGRCACLHRRALPLNVPRCSGVLSTPKGGIRPSGFGLSASMPANEACASHLVGEGLPAVTRKHYDASRAATLQTSVAGSEGANGSANFDFSSVLFLGRECYQGVEGGTMATGGFASVSRHIRRGSSFQSPKTLHTIGNSIMQPVQKCKEFNRSNSDPVLNLEGHGRQRDLQTGLPDCDHQAPCRVRD